VTSSAALGGSPTDRLRDLEQHGLVERVTYAEIPPRVEYTLTKKGRTLEPVIGALAEWGRSVGTEASTVPGR
jgi:DNA-binding HxlR family transcriptional regulator